MLFGNFLAAITCWILMVDSISFEAYISVLVLQQCFIVTADVNYDTLMLLHTQREDKSFRGKLQTYIEYWREFGTAFGLIAGGPFWGLIGSKGVFGVISAFYIFSVVICLAIDDDVNTHVSTDAKGKPMKVIELDSNGNAIDTEISDRKFTGYSCAYTLGGLHQAWLHPILRPLLIFSLVVGLFPSPSTPMFFFMNDQLKYTPNEMALRSFASEAASLFAVLLSYRYARFVPIRTLMAVCIVLKIVLGLVPLVLVQIEHHDQGPNYKCGNSERNVTHWKNGTCYKFELLNIDPLAITCTGDAFEDAVDAFGMFPLRRVTTLVCSSMAQSTVYSFILSLMNITGAMRGLVDYFFLNRFGIDHGEYEALPAYVIFCSILDIFSLCIVPLLPSTCVQDIASELERQKYAKDILHGEFAIVEEAERQLAKMNQTPNEYRPIDHDPHPGPEYSNEPSVPTPSPLSSSAVVVPSVSSGQQEYVV
jgi:hypothetical protein